MYSTVRYVQIDKTEGLLELVLIEERKERKVENKGKGKNEKEKKEGK